MIQRRFSVINLQIHFIGRIRQEKVKINSIISGQNRYCICFQGIGIASSVLYADSQCLFLSVHIGLHMNSVYACR